MLTTYKAILPRER